MMNAIKKYANDNPELTIEAEINGDSFSVVLVTPFMKRIHGEFREASEVVFVDATGCVDKLDTAIVLLLCAGPAGAAPLEVLFTSSQDEASLTRGFKMVQSAVGEGAFFGKGTPQAFMTDNSDSERNALAATWPTAQLFLCIFHLLQQVWRWLLDSKHGIKKENRQVLMAVAKKLVYAESRVEFAQIWNEFQTSSLADTHLNFTRYLRLLVERKEEWALTFRAGTLLRGHHTNNFCESTMCIIKDIILNRCKAYNASQLVVFMAEIFDAYMKQRLVEVALGRRSVKNLGIFSKIPAEKVIHLGGVRYEVESQTEAGKHYSVDLNVGMCTCIAGETGAPCKHQVAAAEKNLSVVPQIFPLTTTNRRWIAGVALGQDKLPDENFFKSLLETDMSTVPVNITEERINNEDEANNDQDIRKDISCTSAKKSNENVNTEDRNSCDFEYACAQAPLTTSPLLDTSPVAKELAQVVERFGNHDTAQALRKLQQRLASVKTTNHLNTFLHNIGSERKKGAGRGKIPCQPTSISRRGPDRPRGAAPIGKGRRPNAVKGKTKRPRNLALNVSENVANAKSHGSNH